MGHKEDSIAKWSYILEALRQAENVDNRKVAIPLTPTITVMEGHVYGKKRVTRYSVSDITSLLWIFENNDKLMQQIFVVADQMETLRSDFERLLEIVRELVNEEEK